MDDAAAETFKAYLDYLLALSPRQRKRKEAWNHLRAAMKGINRWKYQPRGKTGMVPLAKTNSAIAPPPPRETTYVPVEHEHDDDPGYLPSTWDVEQPDGTVS